MLPNPTIVNELNKILEKNIDWPNNVPYLLPQHYFSASTLRFVKPILGHTQTIPSGYFENLPQVILKRINEAENTTVPADYFQNFSAKLMDKIAKNELEEIAPALAKIGNRNVYEAPSNYFDKPRVIQKPRLNFKWLLKKYTKPLVAAMLVLTCGGTYLALKPSNVIIEPVTALNVPVIKQNTETPNNTAPIETTVDAALKVDNKMANINIEEALNEVNEEELYAYVDNHAIGANFAESVFDNNSITAENDSELQLEDLSEQEIEAFLKENIN